MCRWIRRKVECSCIPSNLLLKIIYYRKKYYNILFSILNSEKQRKYVVFEWELESGMWVYFQYRKL